MKFPLFKHGVNSLVLHDSLLTVLPALTRSIAVDFTILWRKMKAKVFLILRSLQSLCHDLQP